MPLRKGSKGIPGKNKKKLLGRPLYQWVLGEAIQSNLDEIYVFSDDDDIEYRIKREYSWTDKVKFWKRSEESATDIASTEFCLEELSKGLDFNFDILVLLQATSPLTRRDDINRCISKIISDGYDSSLTIVETKRFIWNHEGESINYKYLARPRRQEFKGLLIENGAVYAIKKAMYLETRNRLGGKIGLVGMAEDTLTEIDEPSDWFIVENILKNRLTSEKGLGIRIKAIVFDVDGVFTNGTVLTGGDGELGKLFSLRDGMGFELAKEAGLEIIVMTSEDSPIVDSRMKKLGITHYYKGVKDKFSLLSELSKILNIQRSEFAYVGDDINDLSNMLSVGWSFVPNDGIDFVKYNADVILHENGGDRAIRKAIEFVLKINSRLK